MGGEFSAPINRDTPAILQFILKEMFRRTDLADIYSLADPDRCKRYIIVATDALESLFLKMRLRPGKGPDGKLYIQSIEGLVQSIPADQKAKQREYCLELAFFFIRIFQIFGALFLSIYDSRLPSSNPTGEEVRREERRPYINPKRFLGFGQRGGFLSETRNPSFYIKDTPYDILNYHLMATKSESREPMRFDKYNLILDQYSIYTFPRDSRELKSDPQPIIGYYTEYAGTNIQIQATLEVRKAHEDNSIYIVRLVKFEKKGSSWPETKDISKLSEVPAERLEQLRGSGSPPQSLGNNYKKTRGETLPAVLKAMFDRKIIELLGEPPLSVIKFLKQYRYLSTNDSASADKISGTHVYIKHGQENESEVEIIYSDRIEQVSGDRKRMVDLSILAKLKLTKLDSDVRGRKKYRAELSFNDLKVRPSEFRDILDFPREKYIDVTSDSDDRAPKSENSVTIPEFIEKVFKGIVERVDESREFRFGTRDFQRTREGLIKPYDSERIPDSMRVRKLWEAMAKDPPVKAHCIARAVQLLSVDAIKGDLSRPAYTSICQLKFPYTRDGSLPTPGQSVISSAGIYGLSLLFFEGLSNGAPKILDGREYAEYRRTLQYLFEGYTDLDDVEYDKQMAAIRGTVPKFCKGSDQTIAVSPNLARNLRGVTSDLIRQQQSHFQRALSLIFKLFDQRSIERERELTLNERILAGGMPEIDRIADQARDLLLEYYKGCEMTYREGLVMIYDEDRLARERDRSDR
jgi:hypothetical protein